MIKQTCSICDGENWEYLDHLRDHKYWYKRDFRASDEPVGFKICKDCGYCTYDYIEDERLAESYDNQRKVMGAGNIITCNRKNLYHDAFLSGVKIKGNVLDVGCAQGSFLDYLATTGVTDRSMLYGTEWSSSFSNWAKYEYNINMSKEIDDSRFYGFISYYHVLEHIQYPDKELEKAIELLEDDGLMYISVPTWFDTYENWDGVVLTEYEYHYHLNHVNVFSVQSLKNLLNKVGLEVIKEDGKMYAYTVLCKKADKKAIVTEDYKIQIDKLERQRVATKFVQESKHKEALEVYPKYPDAAVMMSLNKENMKNFETQDEILSEMMELCPESSRILSQLARLYFQWDENTPDKQYYSNNIKRCEELFLQLEDQKPNEESWYFLGLIEGKYKKDYDKACKCMDRVIEINPQRFTECNNLKGVFRKEQGNT